MKKNFTKAIFTAALTLAAGVTMAQTNLGADCGCPAVSARTTVLMSTLADNSGGATDGNLTAANTKLTCDKIYILDKKIFVPDGKSLTIQPGTLIKGDTAATTNNATALVVSRGGKIFAAGTASCPIVFTSILDPMDGTYGVVNTQKWGGVVLLGRGINNLASGQTLYISPGVGRIEGFSSSDPRSYHGEAPGVADNSDNSGIMTYVSIRHCGATIAPNNELNGLTMGSVGSGTTLSHIEIVASSDDGFEWFGGAVNLKHGVVLFNEDDAFDWDENWTGKGQFWFYIKNPGASDNGFECDGDDGTQSVGAWSHPIIYNATCIGDDTDAGIEAKERTEGEIYNSIFANFAQGFNVYNVRATDAYQNWNAGSLKVNNCTFISNVAGFTVQTTGAVITPASGADLTKFQTDGNVVDTTLAGFDFTYAMNASTNAITDQYDAVPNPTVASTITAPQDGFFTPVNYRGAFSGNQSWMNTWSYAAFIDAANGLVACPTDLNGDGITKVEDFLILLGQFNASCD
ncbi:MAG: hypothetical protein ACKOGP_01215 [Bacteroidota bacterium]